MSQQQTSVLSQQQTSVLSQQQTSVLSQQKTSVLSQQQILSTSEICRGPDTSKWPDLDNRKVTFQTNATPKSRIAVRFQWAQSRGELVINRKKIKWEGVSCRARPQISNNGRKWPQNGPQELRIEPRASPGLKTLFAADPGARWARQYRDSADWGSPPSSKAVEAAEAAK